MTIDFGDTVHLVEDWADATAPLYSPISARTATIDGITCDRSPGAAWVCWPDEVVYGTHVAYLPNSTEGAPGDWSSPTTLVHQFSGPANTQLVAFSATVYAGVFDTSGAVTQFDVEITTAESGFGGPSLARFRLEANQDTMGVAPGHCGALLDGGSYADGGVVASIFYTVVADVHGAWEVRAFAPPSLTPSTVLADGPAGSTALRASPSNRYLARVVARHDGHPFHALECQIRAWTAPSFVPIRKFPRDDGFGLSSAARIFPPPKSGRIVGGYQ